MSEQKNPWLTQIPTVECIHPISKRKMLVNHSEYHANKYKYTLCGSGDDAKDQPEKTGDNPNSGSAWNTNPETKHGAGGTIETPVEKKAREKKEAGAKKGAGN